MVCQLVGLPTELASDVLATVNAGSLAKPGDGVDVANARPGYLDYLLPIVERRRAEGADGTQPIVDGLISYRLPDGSAFSDAEVAVQMLGVFIGGTETVPKIVAHGLWELSRRPDQLAAVRADLDGRVPVAREEMIRYCAPAQWFARTLRTPFTIHGTTMKRGSGSSRCWRLPPATSASTPNRTSSSGTGRSHGYSRSGEANTFASASTLRAWRSASW
jgi:cytochrome P450